MSYLKIIIVKKKTNLIDDGDSRNFMSKYNKVLEYTDGEDRDHSRYKIGQKMTICPPNSSITYDATVLHIVEIGESIDNGKMFMPVIIGIVFELEIQHLNQRAYVKK